MPDRRVQEVTVSRDTTEGAGVRLHRAIGFGPPNQFDPFLLLDDFRSDRRADYVAGFPWHPHRGMETITYVLRGKVEHGDSMSNHGVIGPGDVQWMTAGSGIIHQEMPSGDDTGAMYGFQLWLNLPRNHKMMPPRYREVLAKDIPTVQDSGGATVHVVAGAVGSAIGPVRDVVAAPEYLDVTVPPGATFIHPTPLGHTVLAYVIAGRGAFGADRERLAKDRHLVSFGDGNRVTISGTTEAARFLLISGKPIREPIAWAGPIVMNTQAELEIAFDELDRGTFIKQR